MALLHCDIFSDVLGLSTSLTVILPQVTTGQIGMTGNVREADPPLLYLLHGLSDDHTIWLRRTSIERYVAPLGVAVVMPQVDRSFYTDEAYGNRYWTYLSEELPELVHGFFRLSRRREDTFVAGLSMGGYGAMKWALRYPERFAAAASLSGAFDIAARQHESDRQNNATQHNATQDDATRNNAMQDDALIRRIFGDQPVAGTDNDLFALLEKLEPASAPALYVCCGTEDALHAENRRFTQAAAGRNLPLVNDFGPGAHDWAYWDAHIQDVLAWLPLAKDPRPSPDAAADSASSSTVNSASIS